MTRFGRRHRRWTPLVGAAVVPLLAASSPAAPAVAAPDTPQANPLARVADRLAASSGQTRQHDVTLVTGDTVHVRVAANGAYTTRVDLAPRPDGRHVFTQTLTGGGHTYVIPSDAAELVAAGTVDLRLFDVETLVEDGYTDAASATLPVIVQYAGTPAAATTPQARARTEAQVSAKADALPASRPVRALGSIDAAAVAVTKRDAHSLWSTLDPQPGARALGAGVSRIWLDGRVKASLDVSVPMIGAPEAWAAGHDGTGVTVAVLDTGIDESHPDLTGKVVAARSFVPNVTSVRDGNGHGTHVASTIAGSGAASGGKYRGVAPGADLVVGKVLDDGGHGSESAIIDAMEWATTTAGARIVSMSLGSGEPSDGTDPMSQAVDDLTARTGALFVIAAGNEGPAASTVAAPGAADAALTVAAVDKSDQLANFSNRGPRVRDYALKPEIAAPGVNITAARAAGTQLGPLAPDNDRYITISGTSMATPHVAGAAAILAQQHPDWTGEQLRQALTGTSRDDGYSVYEQGAGRVDVAAATRTTVLADTKVDFGRLRWPHTGPAVSRTLTYHNLGDTPVTLDLAAGMEGTDGAAAPDGMLTVTPSTLDVPAGDTAQATVTLDPTLGPLGAYSGVVTAAGAGVSLRTPVGAYKEPEGFDLTIDTVVPDRAADGALSLHVLKRVDRDTGQWILVGGGLSATTHLDAGVYAVYRMVQWGSGPGDWLDVTVLADPEVTVTRDTRITLDANTAARLDVETADRTTEAYGTTLAAWRIPAGSSTPYGLVTGQSPYLAHYWVTPTEKVAVGGFLLEHQHLLGTPLVTADMPKQGRLAGLALHPRYQNYSVDVPKLDGRMELPVVDVGRAGAEELATVDLRGKVALMSLGDRPLAPLLGAGEFPWRELKAMAEAGARAVVAYADAGWPVLGTSAMPSGIYPLPTIALPAEEGTALHDRLARGPASLRINSQPGIPDVYNLSYVEEGSVPAVLARTVSDSELTTLNGTYHADRPVSTVETWGVRRPKLFQPDDFSASFMTTRLDFTYGPTRRTEHLGPTSDAMPWYRGVDTSDLARSREIGRQGDILAYLGSLFTVDVFARPVVRSETWGQSPTVPGTYVFRDGLDDLLGPSADQCALCRYSGLLPDGDVLPVLTITTDGFGNYGELTTYSNNSLNPERSGVDEVHLYRDGTELPQQSLLGIPGMFPFYVLPPGTATYRMTQHFESWLVQAGYGNRADTAWTFASADPTAQETPNGYDAFGLCFDRCRVEPLLFLRYQFHLGLDNRLPAPGAHTFTVTAYRQPSNGAAMPDVAGMTVWASVDGGRTWAPAQVEPRGGGAFSVTVPHPRIDGPTGTVSLRTEAWDTAGNRVEQTIPDAYGLVGRN